MSIEDIDNANKALEEYMEAAGVEVERGFMDILDILVKFLPIVLSAIHSLDLTEKKEKLVDGVVDQMGKWGDENDPDALNAVGQILGAVAKKVTE